MTKEEKLAYQREWYAKNKDRERAKRRAEYAANPDKYREKSRQYGKRWRENNPDSYRATQRRYRYGSDGLDLLEAQGGMCGICGKQISGRTAHLDHDHATGEIRGWLCQSCNTGLGKLGDSVDALERAIAYLRPTPRARSSFSSVTIPPSARHAPSSSR